MTAVTLKNTADHLTALAELAPGAEVTTVTVVFADEVAIHTPTSEQRLALAVALQLSPADELVGAASGRPMCSHEGDIELDGDLVTVTVYGPRDAT